VRAKGLAFGLLVLVALCASTPTLAARPLDTAISTGFGESGELAMQRLRAAGATSAYLVLVWNGTAPAQRPPSFDAANPFDPAYRWGDFDERVRLATRYGLRPVVAILFAPPWAEAGGGIVDGTRVPDPAEFGKFARAAAARYSGAHAGLPRVRFWQAWSEPNISPVLSPQFVNRTPFSPGHYRTMLNQFAAAVRSVRGDNVVIGGGLAPFRDRYVTHRHWGPLAFMRNLLCVSKTLRRTCRTRVSFDVWSHHPFTSGGPTHSANHPDDVSLGDLREVTRLVRAARRLGNVDNRGAVRFWATEFSWDTRPPDPEGVPLMLHRRWTAEALYRLWAAGFSFVSWAQLRDDPLAATYLQSGLYFRGATVARDRPKPSLQAFRFPLVAFPRARSRVYVWGRTPAGKRARVVVEQRVGKRWRRLGALSTNGVGIFQRTFSVRTTKGSVRAKLAGRATRSAPFSLARVPDRRFNPFGTVRAEN
jgi:hypothetical protein